MRNEANSLDAFNLTGSKFFDSYCSWNAANNFNVIGLIESKFSEGG